MITQAHDIPTSAFPSIECYRLNLVAAAVQAGLDVARLEIYRRAVLAGFFSDNVPA
jgi:hypothetical protein